MTDAKLDELLRRRSLNRKEGKMSDESFSEKEFDIFDGMEKVNRQMDLEEQRIAPICHFRPMFRDMSDSTDGYYEEWWECSVCGHTKDIKARR